MARLALALLVVIAATATAGAQPAPEIRVVGFAERGENLVMRASFTDVFDKDLLEQLSSGFAQTVQVQTFVQPAGSDASVYYARAVYRVVYAQWDEVYLVRLRDPSGERNLRFASRAEALKAVTTFDEFPVAPLSLLPIGKLFFVAVLVEVNPVAPELLADVRRWLARPRVGQVGGDASFFGSFVSVFVNPKISAADRTLRFRTQDFYRVPR
jgi:hypothetical protein